MTTQTKSQKIRQWVRRPVARALFCTALVLAGGGAAVAAAASSPSNQTVTLSAGQSITVRCPGGILEAPLAASPFKATCTVGATTPTTVALRPPLRRPGATRAMPVFTTKTDSGYTFPDGYIVYSDMWNDPNAPASGPGSQQIVACSPQDWSVTADMPPAGQPTTDVKTYPSVQDDFASVPVSGFSTLTSSFAETDPHVGDYEDAYDIWLDGEAQAGSHELMIWNENNGQTPAGSLQGTVSLDGHTWDVYETSGATYVAFVATSNFTSGSYNLLDFINYAEGKGWYSSSTYLSQVNYGVEICSTGGAPATFGFSNFEVDAVKAGS